MTTYESTLGLAALAIGVCAAFHTCWMSNRFVNERPCDKTETLAE